MTRTPISIVREAKDIRRNASTYKSSGGYRRCAYQPHYQPNLAADSSSGDASSRPSLQRGSQSQRKLPSLPNPFTTRSSKASAQAGERRQVQGDWDERAHRAGWERAEGIAKAQEAESSAQASLVNVACEGATVQLSVEQAFTVLEALQRALSDGLFQDTLKQLHRTFPERKTRGHADGAAFFDAFERLMLDVYKSILPFYGYSSDWDGVSAFYSSLLTARNHAAVRELQEHVNLLMGLPRDVVLRPRKKKEEILVYRPNGDGVLEGWLLLPAPLITDDDGDEAHEFWEEDSTGELLLVTRK